MTVLQWSFLPIVDKNFVVIRESVKTSFEKRGWVELRVIVDTDNPVVVQFFFQGLIEFVKEIILVYVNVDHSYRSLLAKRVYNHLSDGDCFFDISC